MASYRLKTFEGVIVRYFRDRAYGFVRVDASPREAQFHLRDCYFGGDEIKTGHRLEFYLEQTTKGLNAIRCNILRAS